jgi:hypothetical protein
MQDILMSIILREHHFCMMMSTRKAARPLMWGGHPLSYTDPDLSRASCQKLFEALDASGVVLAGVELGIEISWAAFNPEFPLPGRSVARPRGTTNCQGVLFNCGCETAAQQRDGRSFLKALRKTISNSSRYKPSKPRRRSRYPETD